MSVFEGAGVALITPMKENGDVDFEKFSAMIDYQIEQGTDAILVCGTTGEPAAMTHEEHIECIRAGVAAAKKRVPVIAGTGSNCTKTAVYLTKEAEKAGADSVLVVSPYYNKATQKGMEQHFTEIAKNTSLPVLLYNIPGRTGVNIQPKTIASLVKNVENIVGVKSSVSDLGEVVELVSRGNGEVDIYSGDDNLNVPYLSLGAKGVFSVLSNIAPKEVHDMVALYQSGSIKESLALQMKYFDLIKALFMEVNPIPAKKAAELCGWGKCGVRMPLTEMEPEHVRILEACIKKCGIDQSPKM